MKFSVGVPASPNEINRILEALGSDIHEIYLAADIPFFGTGRDLTHSLDVHGLRRVVDMAQYWDVTVRVLMNTPFFTKSQERRRFEDRIKEYFDLMLGQGIEHITIADPRILMTANRYYPGEFHIAISSYAHIDNVELARGYANLGANRLILPSNLVRDFRSIRNIRNSVTCELEIMANLGCQYGCPAHTHHGAYLAEISRFPREVRILFRDPYREYCTSLMQKEPWRIIAGSWIRPEDLEIYEDYRVNFIKIVGRHLNAKWIIRAAQAYVKQTYKGNILDILTPQFAIAHKVFLENEQLTGLHDFVSQCNKECFGAKCTFFDRQRGKNRCEIFAQQAYCPNDTSIEARIS
jgi:collagenase-like PrtC family protease